MLNRPKLMDWRSFNVGPLLKSYDFTSLTSLPSEFTFARASSATYFGSDGLIHTADPDTPRFDCTPNAPLNQNLLYPSTFTSGGVPNSGLAPDGTNTAMLWSGAYKALAPSFTTVAGQTYMISLHIKPQNTNGGIMYGINTSDWLEGFNVRAAMDLSTISTSIRDDAGNIVSNTAEGIIPMGDGWYRIWSRATWAGSYTVTPAIGTSSGSPVSLIWGPMVEQTSASSTAPSYYAATTTGPASFTGPFPQRGLLLETQETNLTPISNPIGSGSGKSNAAISPDGNQNASKISGTGSGSFTFPQTNISVVAGQIYNASVFLKAGKETVVQLSFQSGQFGSKYVNFDLANGIAYPSSGVTSATIYPMGNGWWRASAVAIATASGSSKPFNLFFTGNNIAATGSNASVDSSYNYYVYGTNVTQSPVISSYIPSSGSATTRAADICYLSSPSWLSQTSGSLYAEAEIPWINTSRYSYLLGLDSGDGTISNVMALGTAATGNPFAGANISGTTYLSGGSLSAYSNGVIAKELLSYKSGANILTANGSDDTAGTLGAAGVPSGLTQVNLADRSAHDRGTSVWYRKLGAYTYRSSSSDRTKITT